jgi:hypothetical protein
MVDDKGKQVILRAGKAQLIITGPELESGKFSSEVILEYGNGMRIITPHATYAHKKGFRHNISPRKSGRLMVHDRRRRIARGSQQRTL